MKKLFERLFDNLLLLGAAASLGLLVLAGAAQALNLDLGLQDRSLMPVALVVTCSGLAFIFSVLTLVKVEFYVLHSVVALLSIPMLAFSYVLSPKPKLNPDCPMLLELAGILLICYVSVFSAGFFSGLRKWCGYKFAQSKVPDQP